MFVVTSNSKLSTNIRRFEIKLFACLKLIWLNIKWHDCVKIEQLGNQFRITKPESISIYIQFVFEGGTELLAVSSRSNLFDSLQLVIDLVI